jgi:hypothetical protein
MKTRDAMRQRKAGGPDARPEIDRSPAVVRLDGGGQQDRVVSKTVAALGLA